MLNTTGILSYFEQATDKTPPSQDEKGLVQKLLIDFFGPADLSLREVAQAVHRLGLVFASLAEKRRVFGVTATLAVILRTIDTELYRKFVRNQVSDLDIVEKILDHVERKVLLQDPWKTVALEAFIILAAYENATDGRGWSISGEPYQSPLMLKYRGLADQDQSSNGQDSQARQHAIFVIQHVENLSRITAEYGGIGFRDSVNHLELLSVDLSQE